MSLAPPTVYRIDATGRLCYVNEEFRQAALEEGVADLPDRVLGTPLRDHIYGEATKEWYRYILNHVARAGAVSFEFQCDTPTLERRLSMAIKRLPYGSTEFTCVMLSSSPRPLAKVLDRSILHSTRNHIIMCSICLRVRSLIGWITVDEATRVLQIFQESVPPSVRYTVCDADEEHLAAMLNQRIDEEDTT